MRILVAGYGSIGTRHVDNLLSMPRMEILVCTKRKDTNLEKKGCKVYDSLDESIKEKPDVGIIANATSFHVQTAIKLANAGCHLFIEKPLSNSMQDVGKLLNIVTKKKLITLMGCHLRFHKCIRKIKEIISRNEIGRIVSVHVESGSYLPDWHPYEDYRKSYAARKILGGGVTLTCIHEIDYLYWYFGQVKEVFSFTGKFSDLDLSVDDLSSILLKFRNNVIGEIHLDYFQRPDFRSCKIIGTRGTIYWDSDKNSVDVYDIKKKQWIQKMKINNYNRNDMYVEELLHFFSCIRANKETINDITQGIKTLEIALAAKKASTIKRVVSIS